MYLLIKNMCIGYRVKIITFYVIYYVTILIIIDICNIKPI